MMRLAVTLGVAPGAFWRLSLREWRWLTARPSGGALRREDLERMAERWPDDG
ncbi:phage tail assembly chaperone [Brevundimonas sp. Leaf363]|uniref:phage tail assembly chaperone n=1 Tax=Brevundimonas sp. Leaf363 TaxID=1736353 RepID=UPI0009E8FAE5|nr:phage tail assembly chaperone [Brevundimonas sp. Leaf363]